MDLDAAINARKTRWQQFYHLQSPVRFLHLVYLSDPLSPPYPYPRPDNLPQRIEYAWRQYTHRCELLEWLEDDSLPFLNPYTGTEIFAEAFGCKVVYPADNMPFALPLIESARQVAHIKVPELSNCTLARCFEIADALRARAPSALVRLVDIQSPMDIAALIWEKRSFYAALIETPKAVLELASKVRELMIAFLDAWFARYGSEYIAHFPDYYMLGGVTLSEDEIGVISPRMFERYFLPEMVELSTRYGGIGVHSCANSRHQWAGFTRIPGLRLLNLNLPPEVLKESESYFAPLAAQYPIYAEPLDFTRGLSQFAPGAHIIFESRVNTRSAAEQIVRDFQDMQTNADFHEPA